MYFLKRSVLYSETLAKHPVYDSDFVCFIFTAQRGEYNVIVCDREPIRLLESPRSLSVYMLKGDIPILVVLSDLHNSVDHN